MQSLLNLYIYRGFVWKTALLDLRDRHAATTLGFLWNVVHPVTLVAVYTVVFSTIMPARFSGAQGTALSFALFLSSGLLPWLFFTECITGAVNAIMGSAGYLRKLAIPEEVFVARAALTAFFIFTVYVAVLVAIGPVFGHWPHWTWLLMLPLGALLLLLAYGIGLTLSILNVFFRDISHFLPVVLNLLFWLTPIAYVSDVLPATLAALMKFNPIHHFMIAFRDVYLNYSLPRLENVGVVALLAVAALLVGQFALLKLRGEVRDTV